MTSCRKIFINRKNDEAWSAEYCLYWRNVRGFTGFSCFTTLLANPSKQIFLNTGISSLASGTPPSFLPLGHMVGSISSRCSGKEPALLPRGGTRTRHERAADIEPSHKVLHMSLWDSHRASEVYQWSSLWLQFQLVRGLEIKSNLRCLSQFENVSLEGFPGIALLKLSRHLATFALIVQAFLTRLFWGVRHGARKRARKFHVYHYLENNPKQIRAIIGLKPCFYLRNGKRAACNYRVTVHAGSC